ncbi:hypothetical protein NY08_1072 [Rhodococcus sp. B7740]|nr:hypothetical protein NY08_1072 [Rhodococcus sp. B7740]
MVRTCRIAACFFPARRERSPSPAIGVEDGELPDGTTVRREPE